MSYNKKENYCSFSPDKLFGVTFNYACFLHDRQYRNEVKIRKTRKQADLDLKKGIYNFFSSHNKQKLGLIVSNVYYYAVRLFCGRYWVI